MRGGKADGMKGEKSEEMSGMSGGEIEKIK